MPHWLESPDPQITDGRESILELKSLGTSAVSWAYAAGHHWKEASGLNEPLI